MRVCHGLCWPGWRAIPRLFRGRRGLVSGLASGDSWETAGRQLGDNAGGDGARMPAVLQMCVCDLLTVTTLKDLPEVNSGTVVPLVIIFKKY